MPNKKTSKKSPLKWLALVVVLALIALWGAIVYVTAFAKTDRPAQTLTVDKGDTYHSLLVKDKWQTSPFASSTAARLYLKFHAKAA